MQARLTIEQNNVAIYDMPLDNITNTQSIGNRITVPKFQEFLIVAPCDKVGSRVNLGPVSHSLFQYFDVVLGYAFRIRQDLGYSFGDSDFINS
jgi:hypothetical protein